MNEFVTPVQVEEVAQALRGLVARLDPDYVTAREAPGLFGALEDIRRLAAGAQLVLAHRIDDSDAPKRAGLRNGAEWIAQRTGQSPSAGHDQMAASRRLTKLARLASAVRRGVLSPNQAQAIAGAAEADPAAEERLIGLARSASLGELRRECARVKAAADPDPEKTYERTHRHRRLRSHTDDEGFWCLNAKGTVDAGAEIETTLRAITEEIFTTARASGVHEPREAYLFDALVETARRAWSWMHHDHTDTETQDGPVNAPRARDRKPGVNPNLRAVIRVDLEALQRGHIQGEEVCEITGLGPIPVRRARQLLGDAALHLVITKGQEVAHHTYLGRGPNAAQRGALYWLAPECARLGCHRPATQHDHRHPYAQNPVTQLHNLDGLCDHDHHLKTHQGWALIPGTGKRPMVPPDHPQHPGNPTFHKRRPKAA